MDPLSRFQAWYATLCNGDWEHQHGVHIETLDNPGWLVKIDLAGTPLDDRPFVEIVEGIGSGAHPDSARWIHCSVQSGVWNGAGDETQLPGCSGCSLIGRKEPPNQMGYNRATFA